VRIADLIRPHLAGITRVVDLNTGSVDLAPQLHLPDGMHYERMGPNERTDERFGAGDFVIGVMGPDPGRHGDPDDVIRALERVDAGARGMLLFGHETAELPYHRLLDVFGSRRCQVLQLASVVHASMHSGAVFERVERLQAPRDYAGVGLTDAELAAAHADELGLELRIANEYLFSAFVARRARARLVDLERAAARAAGIEARIGELTQEVSRLNHALGQRERQLKTTTARLANVETSTSTKLGQTLVSVARNPARGVVRLPLDLRRLWVQRGAHARKPAPPLPPVTPPEQPRPKEERRFLSHTAMELSPRDRPVIVGVVRPETAAALDPDAVVNAVTPNDARAVLERTDPDLVLIETAAFRPGQPWAYAGSFGAVERDRELYELIDAARALQKPVALWRNVPFFEAVGLVDLERRCDLLLRGEQDDGRSDGTSWERGVQLATYNPIGVPADRAATPVYVGTWDRRQSPAQRELTERLLAATVPEGLRIHVDAATLDGAESFPSSLRPSVSGTVHWTEAPALYRASGLFLASPFSVRRAAHAVATRPLEQLATGARLISGPNEVLEAALEGHVTTVANPEGAAAAVRAATAKGPNDFRVVRTALRHLFTNHATRVMLGDLVRLAGLRTDPVRQRDVTIVAAADDSEAAYRIVESGARPVFRAREQVILAAGRPLEREAFGSMVGDEVDLQIASDGTGNSLELSLDRFGHAPWLTLWSAQESYPETHLLDLAVAAEFSRADAVGYSDGEWPQFVAGLPLTSSLVRRDAVALLRDGGDSPARDVSLERIGRQGARLLAVPPEAPSGEVAPWS
jgi:hypothetical protein